MAEPRDSYTKLLVIPLVLLILGGTSAPWWIKYIFPDPAPTAQPNPAGPDPGGPIITAGPVVTPGGGGSTTGVTLTGCVLTIRNPLVSMRANPDWSSAETGKVPPGQYEAPTSKVVSFAGQDQRWFEVTAEGRTGWIPYDTILVESKSAECP